MLDQALTQSYTDWMDKDDIVLKTCETQDEYEKSLALRLQVFCREQSFSETLEVDENDSPFPKSTVLHIIALKPDGTLLGTVRMLKGDDHAKLGRLAVSQDARGLHLGKRLVTQGESTVAGAWGTKRIELSAQHQVEGFYEKCGYKSTGKEEMDEGWRHVCMEKEL